MMMKMLVISASPMTILARMMTPLLMNRKRKGLFLQFSQGELSKTMPSQQKDSCWLVKQWSDSYRIPPLTRWTDRNGTLARMEEQMYIHLSKAIYAYYLR